MGVLGFWAYSKMSNNVPDKIKPFGTLRDFGAGHLGHYETFLYGHRLGPFGTLQDFFLGQYNFPAFKWGGGGAKRPKKIFGSFKGGGGGSARRKIFHKAPSL